MDTLAFSAKLGGVSDVSIGSMDIPSQAKVLGSSDNNVHLTLSDRFDLKPEEIEELTSLRKLRSDLSELAERSEDPDISRLVGKRFSLAYYLEVMVLKGRMGDKNVHYEERRNRVLETLDQYDNLEVEKELIVVTGEQEDLEALERVDVLSAILLANTKRSEVQTKMRTLTRLWMRTAKHDFSSMKLNLLKEEIEIMFSNIEENLSEISLILDASAQELQKSHAEEAKKQLQKIETLTKVLEEKIAYYSQTLDQAIIIVRDYNSLKEKLNVMNDLFGHNRYYPFTDDEYVELLDRGQEELRKFSDMSQALEERVRRFLHLEVEKGDACLKMIKESQSQYDVTNSSLQKLEAWVTRKVTGLKNRHNDLMDSVHTVPLHSLEVGVVKRYLSARNFDIYTKVYDTVAEEEVLCPKPIQIMDLKTVISLCSAMVDIMLKELKALEDPLLAFRRNNILAKLGPDIEKMRVIIENAFTESPDMILSDSFSQVSRTSQVSFLISVFNEILQTYDKDRLLAFITDLEIFAADKAIEFWTLRVGTGELIAGFLDCLSDPEVVKELKDVVEMFLVNLNKTGLLKLTEEERALLKLE